METTNLPPCGLYRTTAEIGSVPAGRLVYFHNHGNPGPGVYLPESWHLNRARFRKQGTTLPSPEAAAALEPLSPEGLYMVEEPFHCCEKKCVLYEPFMLVQLGYDGTGAPIVFVPQWTEAGLSFPEMGQKVDDERIESLKRLVVRASPSPAPSEEGSTSTTH